MANCSHVTVFSSIPTPQVQTAKRTSPLLAEVSRRGRSIMSILGGNDVGEGEVIWAPQVIEAAQDHGLLLGDKFTVLVNVL
jgi:hypothetical protein